MEESVPERHPVRHQTADKILAQVEDCSRWVRKAEEKSLNLFVRGTLRFFTEPQWQERANFEGIEQDLSETQGRENAPVKPCQCALFR